VQQRRQHHGADQVATQQEIQTSTMSSVLLAPRSTAKGMYIAVPVNSSDPAKITMVRAEANTAPHHQMRPGRVGMGAHGEHEDVAKPI